MGFFDLLFYFCPYKFNVYFCWITNDCLPEWAFDEQIKYSPYLCRKAE